MDVRPLSSAELEPAAALAATAFVADPAFRQITQGDASLLRSLIAAELRVDRGSGGRLIGAFSPGLAGVAVWFAPGHAGSLLGWLPQLPRLYGFLAKPEGVGSALRLHEAIEAGRSGYRGSAYLRLLAVAPHAQRSGAGAALIESVAREAAGDVYLETAVEANLGYYERRGFTLLRKLETPGLPCLWSMLRRRAR